ncbi:tRNA (adenosine(37)-N6)-threonylcarbamoyltransferase complex transferase subunit TsaD [Candidatus Gottesmanbacteria bacterium]|nr:tRNA (adenosine(37)-N6)-threonylcarbamoyltransferase complex transferase subunit TsaD [Candidatus Gottesmanbacteria bacterium]
MKILAIETSCDETAAAIVEDGIKILSNVVASSTTMHQKYGGIVPEVAAREQHRVIMPVIKETLEQAKLSIDDIDKVAVTIGPGLIGSLLIGVETAKTIAFVTKKPLIPVNHVIAHMFGNFLSPSQPVEFPVISLVVSGGHTELYLMKSRSDLTWLGGTLDDAAGEAFDKTARLLGFGNRGGPAIAAAAANYPIIQLSNNPIKLPRPLLYDKTLNFSFSGLKTAVLREWKKQETHDEALVNAFAYEVQEAITDVLVAKTIKAAEKYHAQSILISGGVAANSCLREKLSILNYQFSIHAPSPALCTDNAVYIASCAFFKSKPVDWHDITALPDLSVEENI